MYSYQHWFYLKIKYILIIIFFVSIGHECIEEIVAGCKKINDDINIEPESASELVAYNSLLDGLESRVVSLEERLEYLRELYDLMGEFNMPIPPDDMTEYLGIAFMQTKLLYVILYLFVHIHGINLLFSFKKLCNS